MRLPQQRGGARRRQKGSVLVESALTLLLFFSLFIAICDFGQFMFLHQTLVERVRAALRYGSVNPYDATAIQNMVLYGQPQQPSGATPVFQLTPSMVAVTRQDAGTSDDRIIVTVSNYSFDLFTPLIASRVQGIPISNSLTYEYQ